MNRQFCATVIARAAVYFTRPYEDAPHRIRSGTWTVERPNHGICFSARQGFLAIELLCYLVKRQPTLELTKIVKRAMSRDAWFMCKVFLLSCFQRAGRQSEVSSSENPVLYKRYERRDMEIFVREATRYFSCAFSGNIAQTAAALQWDAVLSGDYAALQTLIQCAHLLDLRRIHFFDRQRIEAQFCDTVFRHEPALPDRTTRRATFRNMWHTSGRYLCATGDCDMDSGKREYSQQFFRLSNDLPALEQTLWQVFYS